MADMTPLTDILNGDPADASKVQTNFQIIETYINGTNLVRTDGTEVMAASLDMDGNKVVNLADGSADADAVNKGQLDAAVVDAFPAGVMMAYGGAAAPSLWLMCDGTAVSRTTYSALFAAIGTAYGVGDGSTTFNLPDLRDKYPIGDSASLTLGDSVGSNDAVAVAHTHTSTDHSHTYSGSTSSDGTHSHGSTGLLMAGKAGGFTNATEASDLGGNRAGDTNVTVASDGGHGHTYSGETSGASAGNTTASQSPTASGTNANRPASVVVNWIIRAGV